MSISRHGQRSGDSDFLNSKEGDMLICVEGDMDSTLLRSIEGSFGKLRSFREFDQDLSKNCCLTPTVHIKHP